MRMHHVLFTAASVTLSSAVLAGPQCTEAPKSEWMTEEAMKQKLADQGYVIDKFKTTSGSCYEIYGKDRDGRKVEIYFSPVDGSVVKEKRS